MGVYNSTEEIIATNLNERRLSEAQKKENMRRLERNSEKSNDLSKQNKNEVPSPEKKANEKSEKVVCLQSKKAI